MMAGVIERSQLSIALDPRLRGRLAALAAGRVLVVGYFASSRCGSVVGDFALSWRIEAPGPGFLELAAIEGVSIYADRRLLDVLGRAAPELRPGGVLRRGTPAVWLGNPERWIEFLEGPLVMCPRVTG